MDMDDVEHLSHCRDYCNCGTPDPLNEGHSDDCPAALSVEILREVDALTPSRDPDR